MRTSSVDQVILETLSRESAHLTAHQVYEAIRQRLPAVNPSTVYRALDRLAINGKVSISDMGTGSAVYELLADSGHHHLICQKCGQVITMEHEVVERFFAAIQQQSRFAISTRHLILYGICEVCQGEITSPSGSSPAHR